MFIDASALCAVVTLEAGCDVLAEKMDASPRSITSATAVWESVIAVMRIRRKPAAESLTAVRELLDLMDIEVVAIPPEAADLAIDAFDRFGKGRHPAALNFGDCFAYACARHFRVPLLFKGEDFARTDIDIA